MKRFIVSGLVAGLVVTALMAPGLAKKPKPKPKPKLKPVATSLWFHGTQEIGEASAAQYQVESLTGGGEYNTMDSTEPDGGGSSMGITTYGAGPNTNCAGNGLFPVWVGDVAGKIKGDIKVTFFTTSMPAQVDVRVWPDIIGLTCNESYPVPARELRVDVPSGDGKVEAVLKGAAFTPAAKLMVQISPATTADPLGTQRPIPPFVGRVFYDSPTKNSGISFSCLPPKGAKTCTK